MFFTQLAEQFPDANLKFTVMGKNGKITVGILPGVSELNIRPVTLTGTPEEIDTQIIELLKPVIDDNREIISGIEEQKADLKRIQEEQKKKAEEAKNKDKSKTKAATKPKKETAAEKKKRLEAEKKKKEAERKKQEKAAEAARIEEEKKKQVILF